MFKAEAGDNYVIFNGPDEQFISGRVIGAEERFWEAHKNYLDVHLMLHGTEQIDLNFIHNMKLKEFVQKDDFLPMNGEKNSSVILRNGDFLICYPSDGHRTAVAVGESQKIKKAIFKVRIS